MAFFCLVPVSKKSFDIWPLRGTLARASTPSAGDGCVKSHWTNSVQAALNNTVGSNIIVYAWYHLVAWKGLKTLHTPKQGKFFCKLIPEALLLNCKDELAILTMPFVLMQLTHSKQRLENPLAHDLTWAEQGSLEWILASANLCLLNWSCCIQNLIKAHSYVYG